MSTQYQPSPSALLLMLPCPAPHPAVLANNIKIAMQRQTPLH